MQHQGTQEPVPTDGRLTFHVWQQGSYMKELQWFSLLEACHLMNFALLLAPGSVFCAPFLFRFVYLQFPLAFAFCLSQSLHCMKGLGPSGLNDVSLPQEGHLS